MADAYQLFVLAVVQRAIADAQGACSPTGARAAAQIQAEAREWWAADEAGALLELAGYEPGPVLARVRQLLTLEEKGTCR